MKSVLITGASRGIGLAIIKKLIEHEQPPKIIIASCRNPQDAQELQNLARSNKEIRVIQLDTTKFDTFDKVAQEVEKIVGDEGLNCLINNAGINMDIPTIDEVTVEALTSHFLTNTVGPIMLAKAFIPLLKKTSSRNSDVSIGISRAAVINVTSILGSITLNTEGGFVGYRESKAALNMLSRTLATQLKKDKILVTVLHPGWVQTDMGGPNANLTIDESVNDIVKTLYSLNEKHHAGFVQYDGKELPW